MRNLIFSGALFLMAAGIVDAQSASIEPEQGALRLRATFDAQATSDQMARGNERGKDLKKILGEQAALQRRLAKEVHKDAKKSRVQAGLGGAALALASAGAVASIAYPPLLPILGYATVIGAMAMIGFMICAICLSCGERSKIPLAIVGALLYAGLGALALIHPVAGGVAGLIVLGINGIAWGSGGLEEAARSSKRADEYERKAKEIQKEADGLPPQQ